MRVKQITTVAILVALSIITSFFSFPIIPSAPFLKLDFSDLFTLMTLYLVGWKGLLMASCSKGLILYLRSSDPIGAISNVVVALVFNSVYYMIYKKTNRFIIATLTATILLTLTLALLNYTIFLPLYAALFNLNLGAFDTLVLYAIVPFNVIKGLALSFVDSLVIKKCTMLHYSKDFFER